MKQDEEDAIIDSIIVSSRHIEVRGSRVPIEALSKLVDYLGGELIDRKKWEFTYEIPVNEGYVIVLSKKRRWLDLDLGRKMRDGRVDASPSTRIKMLDSHGEAVMKQLLEVEYALDLIAPPNTVQMREEQGQSKKEKPLIRKIMSERSKKTGEGLAKRLLKSGEIKLEDKGAAPETEPEILKKTKTMEGDFSVYDDSGINFRHLVISKDPKIREWAKELHSYQRNIEDRDAYVSKVEELHSKVSEYHEEKCGWVPNPTSCIQSCDVWNLLHLCLYLKENPP